MHTEYNHTVCTLIAKATQEKNDAIKAAEVLAGRARKQKDEAIKAAEVQLGKAQEEKYRAMKAAEAVGWTFQNANTLKDGEGNIKKNKRERREHGEGKHIEREINRKPTRSSPSTMRKLCATC